MSNNQTPRNSIIIPGATAVPNQGSERLILLQADGTPFPLSTATQTLTGYTIAGSGSAVAATDTVNQAIGKLEKRIAVLEAA